MNPGLLGKPAASGSDRSASVPSSRRLSRQDHRGTRHPSAACLKGPFEEQFKGAGRRQDFVGGTKQARAVGLPGVLVLSRTEASCLIPPLSYLVITGRNQRTTWPSVPPPIPSIGPVTPAAPNPPPVPALEKTVPGAAPPATDSPSANPDPVRVNPSPPAAHPTPPVPARTAPARRADGSAAAPEPRRKIPPNLRPSGKKPPVPGSRPPAVPPSGIPGAAQ